jgi:hypothetical protein
MFYHNPARRASEAQMRLLRQLGVAIPERLNSYRADRLIKAHFKQWAALPATPKQEALLRLQGEWIDGLTRGVAAEMIGQIKGQDWPLGPDPPG